MLERTERILLTVLVVTMMLSIVWVVAKTFMEAEDLVEEYPDDFDGGAATSTTGKADGQRSGPADLPGMWWDNQVSRFASGSYSGSY